MCEGVCVPDTLAAAPDVVDDSAGDAALAVVVVGFEVPFAAVEGAVEAELQTGGVDVAVLACGGGVVGQFAGGVDAAVAEFVLARGVEPFGTE